MDTTTENEDDYYRQTLNAIYRQGWNDAINTVMGSIGTIEDILHLEKILQDLKKGDK